MIVYVSIGNSDDKLSQQQWSTYQEYVNEILHERDATYHGIWHSAPTSAYQNACFAVEINDDVVPELKGDLAAAAVLFRQDAVAWAQAETTEFLGPGTTNLNNS